MKRALAALLFTLMLLPSTADAARTKKQKQPRKPVPQAVPKEMAETVVQSTNKAIPAPQIIPTRKSSDEDEVVSKPGGPSPFGQPIEQHMKRGASRRFDLRTLPQVRPLPFEKHIHVSPQPNPVVIGQSSSETPDVARPSVAERNDPAPAPIESFDGLDFATWGSGWPPDTTGDVGPNHYIQAVNTAVGIYQKDGTPITAFSFNTLMAQGNFGNVCDNSNRGDPVVLYDTFEDRWILTDFAFTTTSGSVNNPPGAFQCFAVSQTGDPVSGGWNFYSINTTGGLGDYPKLGVWPDGIYMSVNMFGYPAGAPYQGSRVYAFNKAQMYAGAPTAQVVSFAASATDFTLLPSNARLQAGTPPQGRPNYFVSTWQFLNALTVYKFKVDWNSISLSTFTGPDVPLTATSWPNAAVANAPSLGGNSLDTLQIRAMMQNQYTNIGGVESLWASHTVRRQNTSGFAAPRWYQLDITGGNVNPNVPQAATWDPDAANVMHRFQPSLAVDRAGNMAIGYSTSSATTKPAIAYAGRLAADPVDTFSQTETILIQGAGTQTGNCGGAPCTRWGDYATMSLDPDGCTFWFTTEYYAADGLNWNTRVGSFAFPSCTPVGSGGTVTGTVTATTGGAPLVGATVKLGARTATTNASGVYSFTSIPAGTYPELTASMDGYVSETVNNVVVTDGGTTTNDFALDTAPTSACATDTTQADFQTGVPNGVDLTSSIDNVVLFKPSLDQLNTTLGTSGVGITTTTWGGQTFTPAVSGTLTGAEINLFCSGCTGTTPNLTLSVRATSGGLPTGADLATATIPGFNSGSSAFYSVTFATPPALVAGTMYALVVRPTANPSPGTYALTRSGTSTVGSNVYGGGTRVSGATSGTVWSIPLTGGVSTDAGFRTFMDSGYAPAGDLTSSIKDSNPLAGLTPIWSTLTWSATTPTGTAVQFQVAGSNSINGPFNFVGPDNTASTYFTTSGASLAQFYNLRYLRYKAFLTTTDSTQTPVLHSVSVCYTNTDCSGTISITPGALAVCANSSGNTASGPAGATSYAWSITNGTIVGSTTSQNVTYTAGASGTVGLLLNVVLANGCQESASTNIAINPIPATPTATPGGPTTFCQGGSVTLASSSASGNQWYDGLTLIPGATGQNYVATTSGNYNVVVTIDGCSSSPSTSVAVTVTPAPATPTATPGGPTTFCTGGSVTLTSSSATGNQWYDGLTLLPGETNQTYVATTSGNYNVVVTADGCPSAPSTSVTVTVNPIPTTPTATPGGPTTFCQGGSVTLTSSSASGNQWYDGLTLIPGATNQTYIATTSGNYNVVVTNAGCSSAPSTSVAVTVTPAPATPTATPGGPTTFCQGGSVTLTSSSATGNQWYNGLTLLPGETNQTYVATATGNYNVVVTADGCPSAPSSSVAVTANPIPNTPTATPGGPTTFCQGGSVTLTSNSASGNQWYDGLTLIPGATNQTYVATTSGNYNVVVTMSGCSSAPSTSVSVTVNPAPATPTITPGGPTSFCAGGSVTLTSSSATGNQWLLNGAPIGGATNQTYVASTAGDYSVVVTQSGCPSTPSSVVTVTVNPNPDATITAPASAVSGSTGNAASVASAGVGATYNWSITGGTITSGAGTAAITFTAGAAGTLTLNVTVTTGAGCSDADTASVNVTAAPPSVTVTSVTPSFGPSLGGTIVAISGSGFNAGATVTFGGTAATNVVVVNSTTITARTPAHAAGAVNVTVTNTNSTSGTLNNGFTYNQVSFDPNGDGIVDPSDIFYLIAYLFVGGPAPSGTAGLASGDANGDGIVDPSDIFYVVNYLFGGGPVPHLRGGVATSSVADPVAGGIALGQPVRRGDRWFVPVILSQDAGSAAPRALSLRIRFTGEVESAAIRRTASVAPMFEVSRGDAQSISYLLAVPETASLGGVVAELELDADSAVRLEIDPALTMLVDASGTRRATVAERTLRVAGTTVRAVQPAERDRAPRQQN